MPNPDERPPYKVEPLLYPVTFTPDDFLPRLGALRRKVREGTVGWVPVPEGAWSPDRAGGFPSGFEVAPPAALLKAELDRPRWIIPQPEGPPKTRPANDALCLFLTTLAVSKRLDEAHLRGLTTRREIEDFVREVDDDPLIRCMFECVDTTPRPPLWLYAESFSPLIVGARQRLVVLPLGGIILPPKAPEVALVGVLVLPVWILGPGRPLADATGKVWPSRLATSAC